MPNICATCHPAQKSCTPVDLQRDIALNPMTATGDV